MQPPALLPEQTVENRGPEWVQVQCRLYDPPYNALLRSIYYGSCDLMVSDAALCALPPHTKLDAGITSLGPKNPLNHAGVSESKGNTLK